MTAICLARFPLDEDLGPLHVALNRHGIQHRFTEARGEQCLWLADEGFSQQASVLLKAYEDAKAEGNTMAFAQSETAVPPTEATQPNTGLVSGVLLFIWRAPLTTGLVGLGLLGFLIVSVPWLSLYQLMTFTPIRIAGTHVLAAPWQWHEAWRAVSPVFLHFGIGHIAFNAMALLQMGSWVERLWGSKLFFWVCLSAALCGNILQYIWAQSPMFGGLSGIVYGVFAFNFITQKINPTKAYALPKGLYIWLAVFLLAGFTPLFSQLFGVQVANGAHLGGALGGALMALVANRTVLFHTFKQ